MRIQLKGSVLNNFPRTPEGQKNRGFSQNKLLINLNLYGHFKRVSSARQRNHLIESMFGRKEIFTQIHGQEGLFEIRKKCF